MLISSQQPSLDRERDSFENLGAIARSICHVFVAGADQFRLNNRFSSVAAVIGN